MGLASRQPTHLGGGRAAGVGLALLAALGFGLYFVLFDHAADESVPWAVVTARTASSVVAVVAALAAGVTLRVSRRHLPALVAIGVCDVGANVLFGLATTRGYLSVVSVLAALYPVVTMALAAALLHERIAPVAAPRRRRRPRRRRADLRRLTRRASNRGQTLSQTRVDRE